MLHLSSTEHNGYNLNSKVHSASNVSLPNASILCKIYVTMICFRHLNLSDSRTSDLDLYGNTDLILRPDINRALLATICLVENRHIKGMKLSECRDMSQRAELKTTRIFYAPFAIHAVLEQFAQLKKRSAGDILDCAAPAHGVHTFALDGEEQFV